jgi:malonyl-CoA O-methyltransferase
MNNLEKIRDCFNRATHYDQHCQLQTSVGNQLIKLLTEWAPRQPRILDLGCGTGKITQQLLRVLPYQHLYALDTAGQLLTQAKKRLYQPNITFIEADFNRMLAFKQTVDIVFSNMALHWSTDLGMTLAAIQSTLTKNGLLAFSLPVTGSLTELENEVAINPLMSPTYIKQQLNQHNYILNTYLIEKITLEFPEPLAVLKSLKNIGASHVIQRRHHTLRGKSFINKLTRSRLTYVIAYFIAVFRV